VLIKSGGRADLTSLGSGLAFGSRHRASATEITYAQLKSVPLRTGQDVLMFDWWVRNADRNLTKLGGNPNLLWDQSADALVMIDHNLAFDLAFGPADFAISHVFHCLIASVFEDLDQRLRYAGLLKKAVTKFQAICDNVPEQWIEEAPQWFDLAAVEQTLRRYDRNDFWAIES
jgi:hypothetical protein